MVTDSQRFVCQDAPIGLIDSGVGGLTIAKAIQQVMPKESILYYADTAHLPYGNKSAHFIQHRLTTIMHHLMAQGCKMIVVACHSASAYLATLTPIDTPCLGVIAPILAHLEQHHHPHHKIGLIGTHATITSNTYALQASVELRRKLHCLATPLLAPMIEDNASKPALRQILKDYGQHDALQDIQQLVLACTHYPLIADLMTDVYGSDIDIIHTPTIVARSVKHALAQRALLRASGDVQHRVLMSDRTPHFLTLAQQLFEPDVAIEHAV